jgi:hypothetical protein
MQPCILTIFSNVPVGEFNTPVHLPPDGAGAITARVRPRETRNPSQVTTYKGRALALNLNTRTLR